MKILVTGGSGYLGMHVRRFFDADDLSRRSGLDVLNLRDASVVADYDLVIHLAAHLDKSPSAADLVFLTNVEGTINVLRNVREGAAFVFASTKDVYLRFADNYREVPESCPTEFTGQSALEWSKLIAEHYVKYYARARNFRSCIFRLSTVYAPPSEGNSPNFVGAWADAVNTGEPIRFPGNGFARRDLLDVDDFAAACRAFADSALRHGLYNLGGGRQNAFTLREIVSKMETVSGLQAVIDEQHQLPNPVPLNYVSDIGLVTTVLDWNPKIAIEDGFKTLFAPSR
jgi:nucleoside-diphosphate-sugar epimerase